MLEYRKFETIMTLLVPQVIQLICKNYNADEIKASQDFYEYNRREIYHK